MRKILLNLICAVMLLTSSVYAADNNLNSIVLEGTDSGYNVILRADKVTQAKKIVQADGALLIDLKNITSSTNLDTRYVNVFSKYL